MVTFVNIRDVVYDELQARVAAFRITKHNNDSPTIEIVSKSGYDPINIDFNNTEIEIYSTNTLGDTAKDDVVHTLDVSDPVFLIALLGILKDKFHLTVLEDGSR